MIVVLMLAVSVLLVFGQVLLKTAIGDVEAAGTSEIALPALFLGLMMRPLFYGSVLSVALGSLIWIYVVRTYELSIAYPLVSLSYVLMLFAGAYFFDEKITLVKVLGIFLISIGIVVLMWGGDPTATE